jgi:uncharacterized membrane protein YecN with MAPEG domain
MEIVAFVALLALAEYMFFSFQVGLARGKYEVEAPAVTGHPIFERKLRVQQNTLEQLIVFLPSLWFFGIYVSSTLAALLGIVFVVARFLYSTGYVADPAKRTVGFGMGFLAQVILLFGALIGSALSFLG